MKLNHSLLMFMAVAVPFAGYSKSYNPYAYSYAYAYSGISIKSGYAYSGYSYAGTKASASTASASGKKTFSYGEVVLEPEDGLMFSVADIEDEIGGYPVLSEFLPEGIEVTWTGKKFKVPKAGRVKYSKKEGDFIATNDENPCGFTISISKKTGKVKGSFKVYVAVSEKKLKSYTATFSGYLGGEELSLSIKKAGVYATASLD